MALTENTILSILRKDKYFCALFFFKLFKVIVELRAFVKYASNFRQLK